MKKNITSLFKVISYRIDNHKINNKLLLLLIIINNNNINNKS